MKSLRFGFIFLLIIGLEAKVQAQYWRWTSGNNVMIYQWPYDSSLGGDPCSNPEHFLHYVSDPDYTYLKGPLYNGYLTIALGRSITDLEVTLTSSTSLNHNWIDGFGYTAAGFGLSGDLLTSDSHFMLDPLGTEVSYLLVDQFESPTEIHLHAIFLTPIDIIAANLVGYESSAFAEFMPGINYDDATIIGDGIEFNISSWIPEPSTLPLFALGYFFLRKLRREKTVTAS